MRNFGDGKRRNYQMLLLKKQVKFRRVHEEIP